MSLFGTLGLNRVNTQGEGYGFLEDVQPYVLEKITVIKYHGFQNIITQLNSEKTYKAANNKSD